MVTTRRMMPNWCDRLVLTLITVLVSASAALADDVRKLSAAIEEKVDAAVQGQIQQQQLVGVAVGVIQNGKVVLTKAYGFEDRDANVPLTTDSLIRWASVSKTLTAVVAAQLMEEKKLDLSADVRSLVPEFPDKGELITVRDLLCHQSGIVHYSNGPVVETKATYTAEHPFEDVITALDKFKESPLVCKPREKYSYSTHAYILLSAVTQRAEQKKFADQVRSRISERLKLTTLQPDYQWQPIPHRAVGYVLKFGKIQRSTDTDVSWKLGGGGFISSINDMAQYAEGLLGNQILSSSAKQVFWEPQTTSDGKVTEMGLGFSVDGTGPQFRVSHNGAQEKSRTRLVMYPNRRNAIVVMSNCEYADPGKISTAIYQALSAE
ncbi:MAG: beta-lactamase family protein [Planctomycetaceae bacterium]|nr:beta-lactamase family protein [Planctomycetaceae bacterium]